MPRYSPSPLLTSNPRPSTPPTSHRSQPHHDNETSPTSTMLGGSSSSTFGGLFSNLTPTQHHQQQQQQQSSSSSSGPQSAWGSGNSAALLQQPFGSPSSSSSTLHQVQWGSKPSLLPAAIQWGSTSSYSTAAATSFSSSAQSNDPFLSSAATTHSLSPYSLPEKSRKSEAKRKRLQEDDEDEEMGGPVTTLRSSPDRAQASTTEGAGGTRPLSGHGRNLVPKRIRAGLGGVLGLDESINTPSGTCTGTIAAPPKGGSTDSSRRGTMKDVDLGKMLASLDKPNLLSLLSSLLTQHPQIAPSIHYLLPLPTLESVNQALDNYEAAIKSALPFGSHNAVIRSEYTWNRLRGPVAELVSGVQGWMDFFHAKEEQETEGGAGGSGVHPSTMFTLLHTITARTIKMQRDLLPTVPTQWVSGASSLHAHRGEDRIASSSNASPSQQILFSVLSEGLLSPSNPNALLTTLLPLLIGAWDGLLSRITQEVNGQGKMFGREVVVAWIRGVEGLAGGEILAEEGEGEEQRLEILRAVQKALKGVEAAFKREIGWVIGVC